MCKWYVNGEKPEEHSSVILAYDGKVDICADYVYRDGQFWQTYTMEPLEDFMVKSISGWCYFPKFPGE